MSSYKISMITGDGTGPELAESAQSVLHAISDRYNIGIDIDKLQAGDQALKETGTALPPETVRTIKASDACLKAPVGESAADVIVALRRMLDLYANIRPAKSYRGVPALREDIDMIIVRENTEDLYIGKEMEIDGAAIAIRKISEKASYRIAKQAFELARSRNMMKKVTCVHKSNVMRVTDGLFRRVCCEVAQEYPDVVLEQSYVDACAMNLIRQPQQFDVIVTTNLFGDILSDESSQVAGGLGMAPSANIGDDFALFEPVHGAAFDIAGTGRVNPTSFILSIRMMFEWLAFTRQDLSCQKAAEGLESALINVLSQGSGTRDIGGQQSRAEFTERIIRNV